MIKSGDKVERYKPSFYSVFLQEGHDFLIFSTSTGKIIRVENDRYQQILGCLNEITNHGFLEDPKTLQFLKDYSLITPEDGQEKEEMHDSFLKKKNSLSHFKFTIAPTLRCNFSCSYCFESERKKQGKMNSSIQDMVIEFFKERTLYSEKASIVWFGGEPLLAHDVIDKLSNTFLDICSENNLKYEADIITNGYFLNDDIIGMLPSWNIRMLQVTLDGTPKTFSERKGISLVKAEKFYARFLSLIPKIVPLVRSLAIRINVDIDNKEEALFIVEVLEELGLIHRKIDVRLGMLGNEGDVACFPQHCFSPTEFIDFELGFKRILMEKGFHVYSGVYPLPTPCGAVEENCFTIDPKGYLYKCSLDIGLEDKACAHVGQVLRDSKTWELKNLSLYHDFDPFILQPCENCNLLPVCMGGCPRRKEENKCFDYKKYKLAEQLEIMEKTTRT